MRLERTILQSNPDQTSAGRFVYTAANDWTINARDVIADFTAGGTDDETNLVFAAFSDGQSATIKETSPDSFTTASTANFFDDGGTDRSLVVEYNGDDARVYVDANKDGDFSVANDMVIELDNVAPNALTVSDFDD